MVSTSKNLFVEVAEEVETLTKTKARAMAAELAEDVEANYFKLGGVLNLIKTNGWFDGHESFNDYVSQEFGFRSSKAGYLINIYVSLVDKQIPWEKVSHLGWCKVRELARVLTVENLDEWVAKATPLTYRELVEVLKAKPVGDTTVPTTDEQITLKFKLHKDQLEVVQQGLAKAKGELQTEYDSVALEAVARLSLNGPGQPGLSTPEQLKARMADAGWEAVLMAFGEMWPDIDLVVTTPVQDEPHAIV